MAMPLPPPETTLLAGAAVIALIAALDVLGRPRWRSLSDALRPRAPAWPFALANSPWPAGHLLGAGGGGGLADATFTDALPMRYFGIVCAATPGGGRSPASRRAGPGARRALTLRRPGAQPYAQAGQEQRRCADRASAPGDPAATPGQPRDLPLRRGHATWPG